MRDESRGTADRRADPDERLVADARRGDGAAFACLVGRHLGLLRSVTTRLLGTSSSVDDVVQDAVVTAFCTLDRLREPDRFGPWLAGIGLMTGRRVLRRRVPVTSLDALMGGMHAVEFADPGPSPQRTVEAAEIAARVAAAVGELPAGQAVAVSRFYLAGLSYAETAEHLGVPVSAVKARLHKARRSLRGALADLHDQPPAGRHPTSEETTMPADSDQRVRLFIADVRRITPADHADPRHVVLLTGNDGGHRLALWIGEHEATNLALTMDGVDLPRPSTHHLTAALFTATGSSLAEIVITDLVDGCFIAELVTDTGSTIDARPSDALNLALLLEAPIFARPSVLDAGRPNGSGDSIALDGAGYGDIAAAAKTAMETMLAEARSW